MADDTFIVLDPPRKTPDQGTGKDVVMVGTDDLDMDYGEYELCTIAI